jgi:hypothetical protein
VNGSPPPRYQAVELPRPLARGGGLAWYVWTGDYERRAGSISGGPYSSREAAEAEIARRYEELHELYVAVEAEAMKYGYGVAW